MTAKTTANSKAKAKPRGTPWPKGVSGNPAGAPKRGESWAEIIAAIGEMTDAEFVKLKHAHPTQKQQVVMQAYLSLKNDPQPGIFNAFMDRVDGKVADKLQIEDWRTEAAAAGYDPDALVADLFKKVNQTHE